MTRSSQDLFMRLHCEFVKKLCVHFRIFFRDCRSIKRKKRARIQSSKLGMCTSAYQFLPLPEYRCCIHERFICLSHVPAIGRCSTNSQPTREKKVCLMKMRPTFVPILFARSILRVLKLPCTTRADSIETPMGHWLPVE